MVMTMLMAVISRAALVDVRTCNMTMVVEDETWSRAAWVDVRTCNMTMVVEDETWSRAAWVDVRTCNMTMVVEDETWLQRAKATGIPGHSENASSARFLALPPVPSWLHVET